MLMFSKLALALTAFFVVSTVTPNRANAVTPDEAREIARQAYIYGYAPIANYGTWYKQAVDAKAPEYVGGFNIFRNYAEPFTAANHDVVTPNNDTPYSWAWLDLRAEPIVVSVPKVPEDRYYVIQLIDVFTQNFAYIGSRATGNDAGHYLVVGPKWSGTVPDGITKVFHSETDIVGALGRTALNGPDDVANVKAIQAGYGLQPLSAFAKTAAPSPAAALTFPPFDKAKAEGVEFGTYLNFLLQLAEPPQESELALRAKFAEIGIAPGQPWTAGGDDTTLKAAIAEGVAAGQKELADTVDKTHGSNGLFGTREFLKNDYLKRATGAAMGLYGNSVEEAWYGGYVGNGGQLASIHFDAKDLPPAKFFWSLTLYALPDRFLFDNPLNRYSIGDRTKGLVYGADGSLTLYVGHESPGKDKEANWLPAPAGPFSLVARIYGPSADAIAGKWELPKLVPVASQPQ
jgi:hypothetical protein